ncbi:S24 family peptidase [Streptomyces virginiae]
MARPARKATVKRLHRQNGQVWLIPHNAVYQPLPAQRRDPT